MRKSVLAAVICAAAPPSAAQDATESFVQGNCWILFEGFGQTKILSIDDPTGTVLTTVPGDVVDVIQLFALKGDGQSGVVRLYELRDGTKFVCSLQGG